MANAITPLKRLMDAAGLDYREVAARLNIDPSYLRRIVLAEKKTNGDTIVPSNRLAERISKHFGGAVSEMQLIYPERFPQSKTT